MAATRTKTTCLAVDDHPALRRGLGLMFESADDLDLVATVETGEEALEAVVKHKPKVVIVDVRLPGIDGISTVKRLREIAPETEIVMFTAYGDRRLLSDAILAGARGYVMKGAPPEDLFRAVRTVAEGEPFVDPSIVPALLTDDRGVSDAELSEREREVVQLLSAGLTTDEIGDRIGLSGETVKADTKRAIGKLQADTRTHAVAIALRRALID